MKWEMARKEDAKEKIKKIEVTMGARTDAPSPLEQTHTERQMLKLIHPALDPDTQ